MLGVSSIHEMSSVQSVRRLRRAIFHSRRRGEGHSFREHYCGRCRDVPPRSHFKEGLAARLQEICQFQQLTAALSGGSLLVTK